MMDYNTFYPGANYGDILIASSSVKYIRVGRNNTLRGRRAGLNPYSGGDAGTSNPSNGVDTGQLLVVSDSGVGTYDFQKIPALGNGWTAGTRTTFVGSISGTVLTVYNSPPSDPAPTAPDNYIRIGTTINGTGVTAGTTVTAWGGGSTYTLSASSNVAKSTLTARHVLFWKTSDDILRMMGTLVAGTVAADTVIFTLPEGFRPATDQIVRVHNFSNGILETLQIVAATGAVQVYSVNSGAILQLDAISIPIKGHANYVSGW